MSDSDPQFIEVTSPDLVIGGSSTPGEAECGLMVPGDVIIFADLRLEVES